MCRPLFYAFLLACSGAAGAADLLDIYKQAASSDATYSAARSAWAAAQERIPQARAGLLPLASVSASSQYSDRVIRFRDSSVPQSSSNFGGSTVALSVTQPVYRKQNGIAYDQALTQVEQADAQLALAAQDLILRSAQAYFDVLLAQDNVALAEAQRHAIAEQLEQAKRNFEVGTATITDTHEAQARYDLTTAQEIAARSDLDLRRRALEQVIAREAPALAPLGPRFALKPPQPARMDTWVDLARQSNLQVRVAKSASVFAAQEIERNRAARYPTLDAFTTFSNAGVGSGALGGPGNDTRNAVIGVQLAIPIYQGGAVSSRVREAIANQSRAGDELEGARRTAEFNARQGFLGITNGIAQVKALEAALVSTQSQLDSTRVGQDVGVRTQVDVLNAQQLLFGAQRDLAQAKYTYVLSLLKLEAAVGELSEDDLVAINQWLDRTALVAGPGAVTATAESAAQPSPVVSAPTATEASPKPDTPITAKADTARDTADVLHAVEDWAHAWSSNDVSGYLESYAADFTPATGVARSAWEAERKARIAKPRKIELAVESPAVKFNAPRRATVTFRQQYRSGAVNLTSEKVLVMVKPAERWLIQQERVESEKVNR